MGLVTLDSDLGIARSAELKELLAEHLHAKKRLVDAGAVEQVHTASLQLLAAWWRDRRAAGRTTGWAACSTPLRTAAWTLGLEKALELHVGVPHASPAMEIAE